MNFPLWRFIAPGRVFALPLSYSSFSRQWKQTCAISVSAEPRAKESLWCGSKRGVCVLSHASHSQLHVFLNSLNILWNRGLLKAASSMARCNYFRHQRKETWVYSQLPSELSDLSRSLPFLQPQFSLKLRKYIACASLFTLLTLETLLIHGGFLFSWV